MIINLTPHTIAVQTPSGERLTFASSGRVTVEQQPGECSGSVLDIPIHERPVFGRVTGLPESVTAGTVIVVSAIAASAIADEYAELVGTGHRLDDRCAVLRACVSPGTGPNDGTIREGGQVVAVTRLIRAV